MLAVLACLGAFGGRATADDGTVTPIADTAVATPTPVLATPEVLPTEAPTGVTQEVSTPTPTPVPAATEVPPSPIPTAVPERPVSTPTPTATPTVAPTRSTAGSIPSVPYPSTADLQYNTRLRWGDRIPDRVRQWAYLIVPAARRYHLDPNLIAAVMTMESGGDPLAWSGADARGLMQILHGPWDPRENVFRGAEMLAQFHEEFGNWAEALAAYNAGPGAVIAYGGVPPYRETHDYVIIVEYLYDLFGHHKLSAARKVVYRKTLRDLQHFADQRKKVRVLAKAADVPPPVTLSCRHFFATCGSSGNPAPATVTVPDPFWLLQGQPDPLQRVGPAALAPQP